MFIKKLAEIPLSEVSHNPEIAKKVIISNGAIPKLTTFSQSYFKPGQTCTSHTHSDMWEVYYINEGVMTMTCDGVVTEHHPGETVVIEPGEAHSASNQHSEALVTTYFGIEE